VGGGVKSGTVRVEAGKREKGMDWGKLTAKTLRGTGGKLSRKKEERGGGGGRTKKRVPGLGPPRKTKGAQQLGGSR